MKTIKVILGRTVSLMVLIAIATAITVLSPITDEERQ